MFCKHCGKEIDEYAKFCPSCGKEQNSSGESQKTTIEKAQSNENVSPKSRTIAALLAFFLGGLGIHRFYVGKTGTGILQILLTCCFGLGCIWALIDLVVILCGNFRDSDNKLVLDWDAKY